MFFKSHMSRLSYALASALIISACFGASKPEVELRRVPDGGIQPQAAVDADGVVHLIYFKGDANGGDIFYTRSMRQSSDFSDPIRVNSESGTAVAAGNIRGARIAIGRQGRVYVAWNGSQIAARSNGERAPMLFTRSNDAATGFEPQRNLIQAAYGIDGGGGISADREGRVYVFWHAPIPGSEGEGNRRVWLARSQDDGKTFEPERVAWEQPTGACGCCSLNTTTDERGNVYVLFRSAFEVTHRDTYLLVSEDHGKTFRGSNISKWDVGYCVMSTAAFTRGPAGIIGAWETANDIRFGVLNSKPWSVTEVIPPAATGTNRKYPALAQNREGATLLAWTEGMGWKRGGSLRWQVFDRSGTPVGMAGKADGVPIWSLVAAWVRPDGGFTILY